MSGGTYVTALGGWDENLQKKYESINPIATGIMHKSASRFQVTLKAVHSRSQQLVKKGLEMIY